MLKNNVLLILIFLCGCSHKKDVLPFVLPQTISESIMTPVIVEQPKPETTDVCTEMEGKGYCDAGVGAEDSLHEEVEIQADIPMEAKAVEARTETRDAQIQTEEEFMYSIDLESINLDEDLEDERQEVAPRLQRNFRDMTIYESEYLEESEDEL